MNCIDCRYNLIKDGHYNCTYEEGECMKIRVLEKENAELKEDLRNKKLAIQNRNGRIKELEEKISVLLSCKNCPENKGGYICEKEYEDKCLTQKIQYIKELQEEIAELKAQHKSVCTTLTNTHRHIREELSKAKEIIKKFSEFVNNKIEYDHEHPQEHTDLWNELCEQAEQFLTKTLSEIQQEREKEREKQTSVRCGKYVVYTKGGRKCIYIECDDRQEVNRVLSILEKGV